MRINPLALLDHSCGSDNIKDVNVESAEQYDSQMLSGHPRVLQFPIGLDDFVDVAKQVNRVRKVARSHDKLMMDSIDVSFVSI